MVITYEFSFTWITRMVRNRLVYGILRRPVLKDKSALTDTRRNINFLPFVLFTVPSTIVVVSLHRLAGIPRAILNTGS